MLRRRRGERRDHADLPPRQSAAWPPRSETTSAIDGSYQRRALQVGAVSGLAGLIGWPPWFRQCRLLTRGVGDRLPWGCSASSPLRCALRTMVGPIRRPRSPAPSGPPADSRTVGPPTIERHAFRASRADPATRVEGYLERGSPSARRRSPSVPTSSGALDGRGELVALERRRLLMHPHTSAGRVPTDAGYRFYADALLHRAPEHRRGRRPALEISRMRREVDDAMRETTEALVAGNRPAGARRPRRRPSTATIHRVEVLLLSRESPMVVVIASNGAVTKRVFTFDAPVDPGPRRLGRQLPERAPGRPRAGRPDDVRRLDDPELGAGRAGLPRGDRRPSPSSSAGRGEQLYMEGAARLLSEEHARRPAARPTT